MADGGVPGDVGVGVIKMVNDEPKEVHITLIVVFKFDAYVCLDVGKELQNVEVDVDPFVEFYALKRDFAGIGGSGKNIWIPRNRLFIS